MNADSCSYFGDWLRDRVGGWDAEGRRRFHPEEEGLEQGKVGKEAGDGESDGSGESEGSDEGERRGQKRNRSPV